MPHICDAVASTGKRQQCLIGLAQAVAPVSGRTVTEVAANGVGIRRGQTMHVHDGDMTPDTQVRVWEVLVSIVTAMTPPVCSSSSLLDPAKVDRSSVLSVHRNHRRATLGFRRHRSMPA